MISNSKFGRRRWAMNIWVAAFSASLMVASSPDAAFAQPAPVCSNQSRIDACIAQTCGECATNAGNCGSARGQCEASCTLDRNTCTGLCAVSPNPPQCFNGCLSTYGGCLNSCDLACGTCVAQCRGPCDDLCIVCDAGGPYSIACDVAGDPVIQLDSSGSSDPQGGELIYEWVPSCSGMTVDDETIESPKLMLELPLNCRTCFVTLYLTEPDGGQATCNDLVHVTDETPPEVGRPERIEDCYEFVAQAQSDACEVLADVASDNCDRSLSCQLQSATGPDENCEYTFASSMIDDCDNKSEPVEFKTRVDGELPTATCSAAQAEYEVDESCEAIVKYTGQMLDNCCLVGNLGSIEAKARDGAAFVEPAGPGLICSTELSDDEKTMDIECAFKVFALKKCPAVAELNFSGRDCCGNEPAEDCVATTNVVDKIKPKITCPPPITLDRGDKICNDEVKNWLESATAADNCNGEPTITTDAPECGFPYGSTTEVTFTADDGCGNTATCKSTITIEPTPRVSSTQKGSLLAFSKVEIKWAADGTLIQDTLLDVSNDADLDGVEIQAYFINGDRQIDEQSDMQGNVIQEFEPGWNTADCRFHLTKNQPHFWSAAKGSSKCQPFAVLDADGRLDSEATDGTRLLRGFVVMWAVKFHDPLHNGSPKGLGENGYWEEIRWNHLKGDAVIVNYRLGSAWEYNAWAYQARCGETGQPLLDCLQRDPAGTCCDAKVIPGNLGLAGFQYDKNFDELLMDFYASGSTALSSTDVGVMVDTDLTLHSMDIDVRQDGEGPILTKAEFEIFNENESKFSGTRRCICCWDQTLLSNYVRTVAVPNHFLRSKLGTNKGYARINGVHSDECSYYETCGLEPRKITGTVAGGNDDFSRDTALAGLSFKVLTFTGASSNTEWAGGNLHGSGEQSSAIRVDVEQGTGELHVPASPIPSTPRSTRATKLETPRSDSGGR